jgi:hypothetical protein
LSGAFLPICVVFADGGHLLSLVFAQIPGAVGVEGLGSGEGAFALDWSGAGFGLFLFRAAEVGDFNLELADGVCGGGDLVLLHLSII